MDIKYVIYLFLQHKKFMKTSKRILFIELSDVNFGNPFRFQEIVAI